MKYEERSYAGKLFRPKPNVVQIEELNLLIVITSWGDKSEVQSITQIFKDQLLESDTSNMTSPYGFIHSLSNRANQLRTAIILTNEFLYREVNRNEYITATEIAAIIYENNTLSWVQLGCPQIVVQMRDSLHPLCYSADLSWQANQSAPLIGQGLGIDLNCNFNCGSISLQSNANLVLVSRGSLPGNFFQLKNFDLKKLSHLLVSDNPDIPFWISYISLSSSLS